ncbi:MAG: DUF1460 domain-containing protein [Candidatus Kapabacteria bacterium]|nr:DUF1460 domain-containing protein [Candidatus Kapabacteria bacterium]
MMFRALLIGLVVASCASSAQTESVTENRFRQVMKATADSAWVKLPMGDFIAKVAMQFLGTPYVGGTLEGTGSEVCRVDLGGLDCVTLFENSLNIARIARQGKSTLPDLRDAVTFTRYRDGVLSGYTSRLHYTLEWIRNNVAKGTVVDVSRSLGGTATLFGVDFMSTHPQYYPALKSDPKATAEMARIEERLRRDTMYVIPRGGIRKIESELQTGDIVAIATSKKGLDYAHTGLVIRDGMRARLLHASSTRKQVILDDYLSDVVQRVESWTGISVVRPVDGR